MATQLDLQEQEQLDEIKAFWNQYGNLVTWTLTIALLAYAGWAGWNWWQRDQAVKAGAMFEELDRAATAGDADKTARVFNDLKDRYARTAYAQQGGMLAAKLQFDKGQVDPARASLTWVADNAVEDEYRQLAQLRLAGIDLEAKKYDEALKRLGAVTLPAFAHLAADRRGDVLAAQGKRDEAKAAYQQAWKAMDDRNDYRHLVEAKLTALGASPTLAAAVAAAASAASGAGK
ncbi:hypothetical protein BurJ1DRAFT_2954 [Burkholderiales bacterium JOSHI_001]|nr:hypothetical protein BurJ1DRAFT_2954 [Burkholderiales bacterium JOSHI_001]